jgi:hypothetical protein
MDQSKIPDDVRQWKADLIREYNPDVLPHTAGAKPPLAQLQEIGSAIYSSMARAMAAIKNVLLDEVQLQVTVTTEAVRVVSLGTARWRVYVFLTVFNDTSETIVLNDFHAHIYFSHRINIPPPGSIYEWRSRIWIELKEDNSIITSGHVYEVPSKDFKAFNISVEISRLAEEPVGFGKYHAPKYKDEKIIRFDEEIGVELKGFTLVIFGLFIDYHTNYGGKRAALRIPSDSIVLFQDIIGEFLDYYKRGNEDLRGPDGELRLPQWARRFESANGGSVVHISRSNIAEHKASCDGDVYQEMLLRISGQALDEHTKRSFVLKD